MDFGKNVVWVSIFLTLFTSTSILAGHIEALRPGVVLNQSDYDTLSWRTLSEPTVNFWYESVGVEDTVAVWFQPLWPCSLIAVRVRPFDFEGDCLVNVWDGSRYDGHITTTDSTDSSGWIGGFEDGRWVPGPVMGHSPLGWEKYDRDHHYWGEFPFVVTEYHVGQWVEIPISLGQPEKVFIDGNPFFIAVTLYQTWGHGWAAEDEGTTPYHTFRYYDAGHQAPGPSGHYGWHIHSESVWIEALVEYLHPSGVHDETDLNIPSTFRLSQNYPNPFNPSTDIRYQIADNGYPIHTTLKIYNILGQEMRTLVDVPQEVGYYTVTWDGVDNIGREVGSGIYLYRLEAGDFTATKRMVLIK